MRVSSKRARRVVAVMAGAAALVVMTAGIALAHVPGRMTGGGSIFKPDGTRVTHGFEIRCIAPEGGPVIDPNNLEVNWLGNRFHLTRLTKGVCYDDPAINPLPRRAPFDTFEGAGVGRCNGVNGATIEWKFTDAGEPGTKDFEWVHISGCPNGLALWVEGNLKKGDHQAHPENK